MARQETGSQPSLRPARLHRRIRIVGAERRCSADVEDDYHRFGADIDHDGVQVRAIAGRSIRTPWTTCPMAISQLQALSGAALLPSPFSVLRLTALAQHCTHLVDMAALAIAAAARGVRYRQYDAIIGLADGDGADWRIGTLARDDGGTCRWVVRDGLVCEPSNYAGLEMRRAASWISSRTDDVDAIEETFVMQRAMLVAGGGRFVLDDHPKPSAHVWMVGACFAFQPSRIEQGRRQFGSTRSFTHPDELLVDLASQQTRP